MTSRVAFLGLISTCELLCLGLIFPHFVQLHVQRKLHKNLNPNRGSCSTYARIQYSKLTLLALFAVKARRQKWKYNFGLILPVIRVCLHEMQLCMKPYVRGLLLNKRLSNSSALRHTTHNLFSISPSLQHAMAAMPRVEGKMKPTHFDDRYNNWHGIR